jgi:guanosine-3',5'-bis(diphosphate) 3'-pyrophosphohydrolase
LTKKFTITKMHKDEQQQKKSDEEIVDAAVKDLIDYVTEFLPGISIDTVKKAIDFSVKAHQNQKRASGEPYIIHPIAVAKILAELHLDTLTIVGGLLHDVVEDTEYKVQDIIREFGKKEARIVSGLTKLNKIECKHLAHARAENLRRLLIAVAEDARVLLIKLADRLHNMRTLSSFTEQKKRMKIAKETIDIYAPLAEKIGIHYFKNSLYDLAFEVLYPHVRQSIMHQVSILKENGYSSIAKIVDEISLIMKENNLDVVVKGREKTPFSIWQKMEKKKIYFEDLSDIFAVRIITKKPIDCYVALGVVHTNYKVISKEFFDYVSTPKQNGYSSIHTVVLVNEMIKVEVQIRTSEMHHVSELGMAAHWIYKQDDGIDNNEYQYIWLKKIRSIMENIADADDVLSSVKLNMYYDQVFCFTPNGDVVSLPKNATTLDFAFEVSVELGSHYSKALVNGKHVSINTKLKSGDQVEILTSEKITITHHWFDIVCTSKAKSEIQVYLEKKLFESLVFSGNLAIQDECDKHKLSLNNEKLKKVAKQYNTNVDDLLFNVGNGSIEIDQVVENLSKTTPITKIKNLFKKNFSADNKANTILKNLSNFKDYAEIHFAYCCDPTPGQIAVGIYDSDKQSIIIHAKDCNNIKVIKGEQILYNISLSENIYNIVHITMEIEMLDSSVSLDVFSVFTEFGISKYTVDIKNITNNSITTTVDLDLVIPQQVKSLLNRIKKISGVIDVSIL